MTKKMIGLELDQFKSIDQDYKGQQKYHIGEKVKVVDPDSEHYQKTGKYNGLNKRTVPADIYEIILD